MKIGILGGAFDPPHFGHMYVAHQVKEILGLDAIWLMPCYSYFPEFPVKYSHITSPDMRYRMAKMMEETNIVVSDFEFTKNKQSRSIITLDMLKQEQPTDLFYFVIGSDILPTFHLWNEWSRLIEENNIVVFPRDTDVLTLENRVKASFKLDHIPHSISIIKGDVIVSNIASTHIRKRIRNNLSVTGMVSEEVREYIKRNKLYK